MTCRARQEKLDFYLDGEMPHDEAQELDAHLRSCLTCSSEVRSRSELKRNVHLAGKAFAPDADFQRRVLNSMRREKPARRRSWVLISGVAFAAILLLFVIATVWSRQAHPQQLASELVDLHVTTLASTNRVDVLSSDKHTVKPWFTGRVPFTFELPELQGSPFELIGGKVIYLDQNPGAELLFGVRKHVLSVFIFKDSPGLERAAGSVSHDKLAFNIDSWTQEGLRYFIITDASRADVNDLRARLAAAH